MVSLRALLGAHCESPAQRLERMHRRVLAGLRGPAALPARSQWMWERSRPEWDADDCDVTVVAVS